MKTKWINEPASKDAKRALRIAAMEGLKACEILLTVPIPSNTRYELTYIPGGTFHGQTECYYRCRTGTGNPSKELRFYADINSRHVNTILFVYLDYTKGVTFDITNELWAVSLFRYFATMKTMNFYSNPVFQGLSTLST